jgi:hypothetical protein
MERLRNDLIPFCEPTRSWKTEFLYYRLLAIPPEPPVAKMPVCTAARSRQGRTRQGAAISEPLPASTGVRSTQTDGRSVGVAPILLVS